MFGDSMAPMLVGNDKPEPTPGQRLDASLDRVEALQRRVRELEGHVEQLTAILRSEGLHVPLNVR